MRAFATELDRWTAPPTAAVSSGRSISLWRVVSTAFAAVIATALGGAFGLVVWMALRRRGPVLGRSKLRFAGAAAAVLLLVAGFTARASTAFVPVATCQVSTATAIHVPMPAPKPTSAAQTIETVATAAPSGLAILYATAAGANLCVSPETGMVVAARDQGFVSTVGKGALIGDVFLSWNLPQDRDPALAQHEARHRAQWTVGTAIAGPLAFPAAYQLADFFFPGARNPFERDAGLASGQYDPNTPFEPVLGPLQVFVLLFVGLLLILFVGRWIYSLFRRMRTIENS